jgi:hypothetical protein
VVVVSFREDQVVAGTDLVVLFEREWNLFRQTVAALADESG